MNESAINIQSVTKSFGAKTVLKDLSLCVPKGQTFAFLGRNGAGKTTTIRMLLGLLKPDTGTISVLGLNPQKNALEIRRRVGYLAEDQTMFGWMTVAQIIKFIEPFYPNWDRDLAYNFIQCFELPLKTRVQDLSKGQNCRLGLVLALAHRPELVILDDPTMGLDPIMRKELLRDVIDHLQGKGVTVFFSSHLLYEVEPVADQVAILDRGGIVKLAPTEQLRRQVKRIVIPQENYNTLAPLAGALDIKRRDRQIAVTVTDIEKVRPQLDKSEITPRIIDLNLDEIFEAYVIGKTDEQKDHTHSAVERMA